MSGLYGLNSFRSAYIVGIVISVCLFSTTSFAQSPSENVRPGMTDLQRNLIPALPVFPWLSVGETKKVQLLPKLQQIISSEPAHVMVTSGSSADTGGEFVNLASVSKAGLLGIPGCQIVNIDFAADGKAQLVTWFVDRGWNDKNVQPLIVSLSKRYSAISPPRFLRDSETEATDTTILFDIGRFIVELQVPQHGSLLTVTFTTKTILAQLRTADRTIDVLRPYLKVF